LTALAFAKAHRQAHLVRDRDRWAARPQFWGAAPPLPLASATP